jgi:hypothetical protein
MKLNMVEIENLLFVITNNIFICYSAVEKECMPKIVETAGIHHHCHKTEAHVEKGEDDQGTVT